MDAALEGLTDEMDVGTLWLQVHCFGSFWLACLPVLKKVAFLGIFPVSGCYL